jgi:hypothetical protein
VAVLGIAAGILIPLIILGGIGAAIYFAVRGTQGRETMSFRAVLRFYLRMAYLVSLVVFLVGATGLLTAGFGAAFGKDFSYTPYNNAYPVPLQKTCPPGVTGCTDTVIPQPRDTRQEDDLIRGVSLLVAGLLLGGGHRYAQLAMETPEERRTSWLARAENLIGTIGFGLVALIAIPYAAYAVLRFLVLGNAQNITSGTVDPPGGALATAIVFAPAWLYYLFHLTRQARRGEESAPAIA